MVENAQGNQRYTEAQRHRLRREGVHTFFRLRNANGRLLEAMGDCGAFAYVKEETPPFTVEQVLDFYADLRFDYVLSIDHVIPGHLSSGRRRKRPPTSWRRRQEITLTLARDFLHEHRKRKLTSVPIGVVQGWDARSYTYAAAELQKMGYNYIALGGLAALPVEIGLEIVHAINTVRHPSTRLHLLGVSPLSYFSEFAQAGVFSFDTTSPLRQAFLSARDNYHTLWGATYPALRVPQVTGNATLRKRIQLGHLSSAHVKRLEKACMEGLRAFDAGRISLAEVLEALVTYEALFNGRDHRDCYRKTLEERPWERCPCPLCKELGIEIMLLRGLERNKRRGFHNLYVFAHQLNKIQAHHVH